MYFAPPPVRSRSFLGRLRRAPAHFIKMFRLQRGAAWQDRLRLAARLTWLLIRGGA